MSTCKSCQNKDIISVQSLKNNSSTILFMFHFCTAKSFLLEGAIKEVLVFKLTLFIDIYVVCS